MGTRTDLSLAAAGMLAVGRPDIPTLVRLRKQQEIEKGAAAQPNGSGDPVKILISRLSALQGLSRYSNDAGGVDADYIVVEIAKHVLGENWMPEYVQRANRGGIERVLL